MESGAIRRKGLSQDFRCKARVAHRSPPCKFLGACILQGAIDFAEAAEGGVVGVERKAARSSASPNLHLSLTFSELSVF